MSIVFPNIKTPFAKKKPSAWEQYYSTGKFQESIPEYGGDTERIKDGDLRIIQGKVSKYHRIKNKFEPLIGVYDDKETPEDQEYRLRGNQVLQYYAEKNKYKIIERMPEKFMSAGPPEGRPLIGKAAIGGGKTKPVIDPKAISEYFTKVWKNIPKSAANIGEGLLRLVDPTNPNWAVIDVIKDQRPSETIFPKTYERGEAAKGSGQASQLISALATGLPRDIANLALAPLHLAKNSLIYPMRTLRDDPVGFAMGLLVARGGFKAGVKQVAKSASKGYFEGNYIFDLIESIPDKTLAEYGTTKAKILEKMELPRDSKVKIGARPRSEFERPDIGIKGFKDIVEPPKVKPIPEQPPATVKPPAPEVGKAPYPGPIDMSAGVPGVGKLLDTAINATRQTQLGRTALKKIAERSAKIAAGARGGEAFIVEATQGLSIAERRAMPFVIENTSTAVMKNAGFLAEALVKESPSPAMKAATFKMQKILGKDFDFLSKHHDGINFVENYMTQIWDIPKGMHGELVNYFKSNNPFTKKRSIPSLEVGLKRGLNLKTTDVAEIYRVYNRYKDTVAANVELGEVLKTMMDEHGNPVISNVRPFQPGTSKYADSGVAYQPYEHPYLGGKAYIHPEIFNEIKTIWSRPTIGKAGVAYDTINAFLKHAQLSLTLFHHGALTESALAAIGPGGIAKTLKETTARTVKGIAKKPGSEPYILSKEMTWATDDAVRHKVVVGSTPDVMINTIERALDAVVQKIPEGVGKKVAEVPGKLFAGWNKVLWDHMHNTYKVLGYEKLVFDQLKKQNKYWNKKHGRDLNAGEIESIKNHVGEFINDSFGGQAWDTLGSGKVRFGDPKFRKNIQRILLAPDWTISVLRQASALLRGPGKVALGKELIKGGKTTTGMETLAGGRALTSASRKYWTRMAAYSFLITQSVNLAMSQKVHGEPRFTWENAPGHEYHILIGRGGIGKNEPGEAEEYLRFGKQITEPIRWLTEPLNVLGGKTAPVASLVMRQMTKASPGSGWPTEYASAEELGAFAFKERAMDILQAPVPFSLKRLITGKGGGQAFLMYPVSKGMTAGKTVNYFRKALREEDPEVQSRKLSRIAMAATENGLPWDKLLANAQTMEHREPLRKDRLHIKKIHNEIKGLETTGEKIEWLRAYKDRKSITDLEVREILSREEDRQTILKRLTEIDKEEAYIKRLTKGNSVEAIEVNFEIRDQYNAARTEVELHLKDGDVGAAKKAVVEWNAGLGEKISSLGKVMGRSISGSSLHKSYHISYQELVNMFRKRGIDRTTSLERQTIK